MTGQREFDIIVSKARADAFKVVKREVEKTMPKGWVMHFGVGWGLGVFDDTSETRKTVFSRYQDAPARLPRGFRKSAHLATDFCDIFGEGNEVIHGQRESLK